MNIFYKINKYAFLIIPFLSLLIISCGGNSDDQTPNCAGKAGLDSTCYPVAQIAKPLPSATIKAVNFFIETSGSMGGFMPKNPQTVTDFQKFIPDLLDRLNEQHFKLNLYTIVDSHRPFEKDSVPVFTKERIPKGQFDWAHNTYLPEMLSGVNQYQDTSKVNIFVSDCIYSPTTDNIKVTTQEIAEVREAEIHSAGQYETVIYMLKSDYYPASKIPVKSPYYFIIRGKQENIAQVLPLIQTSLQTFALKNEEMSYGDQYDQPYYSALPQTATTANFSNIGKGNPKSVHSLQEINFDDSSKVKFWVAMDLSALPAYARTPDYLRQNIQVELSSGKYVIKQITDKTPSKSDMDAQYETNCTDFVQFELSGLDTQVSSLSINIMKARPTWVGAISHDTLAIKETLRTKTFGWTNIITGFDQAYQNNNSSRYFRPLVISLIKSNN